jgi:hypothetical protein
MILETGATGKIDSMTDVRLQRQGLVMSDSRLTTMRPRITYHPARANGVGMSIIGSDLAEAQKFATAWVKGSRATGMAQTQAMLGSGAYPLLMISSQTVLAWH